LLTPPRCAYPLDAVVSAERRPGVPLGALLPALLLDVLMRLLLSAVLLLALQKASVLRSFRQSL
jgi:hypothetical protein